MARHNPMQLLVCGMLVTVAMLGYVLVTRLANQSQPRPHPHPHLADMGLVAGLSEDGADAYSALKQLFGKDAPMVHHLQGSEFERRLSAQIVAQEKIAQPLAMGVADVAAAQPDMTVHDTDGEQLEPDVPPDVLAQADANLAEVRGHVAVNAAAAAPGAVHPRAQQQLGANDQHAPQGNRRAAAAPPGKKQSQKKPPGHKKTLEEKVEEWRARDRIWLQTGAISSLLGPVCFDSGNGRWQWALRVWGCKKNDVGANQRFDLDAEGRIKQTIKSKTRCLEHAGKQGGSGLVLSPCDAQNAGQKWSFDRTAALHKVWGTLKNAKTGLCITKHRLGRNSTNNRELTMLPCRNQCNQTWSFGDRPAKWPNEVAEVRKPRNKEGLRILCWILTYPAAHDTRTLGVNNTWGRRCNIMLYMTTEHADDLNTVKLKLWGPEGRNMLWTKSKLAWLHVYNNYRDKADWFMKADDDTYVVVEHLKQFLSQHDTNGLHHFGRKFSMYRDAYYSGGSGIVLSKGALIKLGETFDGAEDEQWAGQPRGGGPEDLLTSKSLKPLGIEAVETLDKRGRQLFMPMGIDHEFFAPVRDEKAWFYRYSKIAKVGPECCSEQWVAIHYTATPKMYAVDAIEESRCLADVNEWPHLVLKQRA